MNNIWHKYPEQKPVIEGEKLHVNIFTYKQWADWRFRFEPSVYYKDETYNLHGTMFYWCYESDLIASIGTEQEQIVPIKQGNEKLIKEIEENLELIERIQLCKEIRSHGLTQSAKTLNKCKAALSTKKE